MTIELTKNYARMGAMSGEGKEWYTAEVGKLGSIHVHDDNLGGAWSYRLTTTRQMDSKKTYGDKETAFKAAVASFLHLIYMVQSELEAI